MQFGYKGKKKMKFQQRNYTRLSDPSEFFSEGFGFLSDRFGFFSETLGNFFGRFVWTGEVRIKL